MNKNKDGLCDWFMAELSTGVKEEVNTLAGR